MRLRTPTILRLITVTLTFWASVCAALEIPTDQDRIDLVPQMVFARGTAAAVEEMRQAYESGRFAPGITAQRYEGDHAAELWAALPLSAAIKTNGRIVIDIPFLSEVDVYLIDGRGTVTSVLSYSLFRPFEAPHHAGARLQSAPVTLPGHDPRLVMFHFKFGPVQTLNVSFEAEAALNRQIGRDIALQSAFYAFAIAAICVFLAYFAALRDLMSLLYAMLFLIGLGFLAFTDGLLFRFFYPNSPQFQSAVGFFLLLAVSGFGYALAGAGFRHQKAYKSARLCLIGAGASAAVYVFSLLSPGPFAALGANVLLVGMCIAVALGTRLSADDVTLSRKLARVLSLGVLAGFLVLLVPLILPPLPAVFGVLDTLKLLYLVLILGGLANLTAQIIAVRRAQDIAQKAEIASLRREAELSKNLAASEKNYATAQALALRRQRTLATAAHDIRQPVQSLRLRLDSLADTVSGEAQDRLREALNYIDTLTTTYMETGPSEEAANHEEPANEVYDLSMILDSVHRMFTPEAAEKGLALRVVPTTQRTDRPAAPLMRLMCNLVVNAIKHSTHGGIVLGVRHRAGGIALCVADTGPGFTPEAFARYKSHGTKGDASDGHGFGLAVCAQLSEEIDVSFSAVSVPGQGTCFYLGLPEV